MQKTDHSGHRSRMRAKYQKAGLDAFAPHEVLELLLYYAIPYRNTNDIAKRLILRFGTLSAVFDAPLDSLIDAGLTENQAVYLKLFPDVTRLYYRDKYEHDDGPLDFDRLADIVAGRFIGLENEERVLLLMADTKGRECFCGFIAEGNFDTTSISVRKIVRLAMNYGAITAVIAHNHPSGVALPSVEDIVATKELRKALAMVEVNLIDHFIIANGECVSLAESNLFE